MTENTYSLPVMETVKTAWAKVSGTKGSFWAIIGIVFVAQFIVGFLGGLGTKGGAIDIIFSIISSLIQIMAGASLIYMGIRRAQDTPIRWKMVRDVLTGRIILYLILLYILEMVIFIPAGLLAGVGVWLLHMQPEPTLMMQVLAGVFFVATAILFIFLAVRLWLAYGTVVDKKSNPWEAVKFSFKATRCNVWKLIGLYFVNVLIALLCVITVGIGFIWGLPWFFIAYGEAYKRLSTRQDMRVG
ncbi:MAG TPA: hypothetical protein VLJ15_06190 [Gammaproteobacteria bacterium]|nr:hypothetical protein [Gammaproteobacteria bacterium]